jgi:hypothetical protein
MRPPVRRRKANRGQSLVEFALSMPVLLLILLGTIDVSRLFFDYIQMRQAVVEGTTYGQRHPFDSGGIVATVIDHGIPSDAAVNTSADGSCATPGQTGDVRVTASKTFTPLYSSTLNALFPSATGWKFNLTATSTMRCFT